MITELKRISLSPGAIKSIKADPLLWAEIAIMLDVTTYSLGRIIRSNDPRLTQAGIVQRIAERTGLQQSEILETEVSNDQA